MENLEIFAFIVIFIGIVMIGNLIERDVLRKIKGLEEELKNLNDKWDEKFENED